MNIIEFDAQGRILSVITYCEQSVVLEELYPGRLIIPQNRIVSQSRDYVKSNEVLPRPSSPVTIDGPLLKGVPAGATIWIDEQPYQADGTEVELEIARKGCYWIKVESWPFMDFETAYENQT